MRLMLFRILGVSLETGVDDTLDVLRNSVYFMDKTATVSVEDIATTIITYADIVGAVQIYDGQSMSIKERVYLMYIMHLLLLDPNAYGLLDTRNGTR